MKVTSTAVLKGVEVSAVAAINANHRRNVRAINGRLQSQIRQRDVEAAAVRPATAISNELRWRTSWSSRRGLRAACDPSYNEHNLRLMEEAAKRRLGR